MNKIYSFFQTGLMNPAGTSAPPLLNKLNNNSSMKRFYLAKMIVLFAFLGWGVNASGQTTTLTYSQAFTGGSAPSSTACNAWDTYRASLLSCYTFSSFRVYGSNDPVGKQCTNAVIATAVANALRTGTAYGPTFDATSGQTWLVGNSACGVSSCNSSAAGIELTGTGSNCNCLGGYTLRPNMGNLNWGGINMAACGASSQTMSVDFVVGTSSYYSDPSGGDASNLNTWWSSPAGTGTHPASFASSASWIIQSNLTCSASPFTFNGTVTVNAGSFTAPAVLNVAGSWANVGGTFIHNNGTVNFNSTSACGGSITLSGGMTGSSKFNNLTFSAVGGAWSMGSNPVECAGNLTISSGTLTASSSTLTVGGSFSNSGTFTHNGGTVIMSGTTGGLTINNANAFNNLTFNGSGGSWAFGSTATINNNFTITNGTVTAPANLFINGSYANNGNFVHNNGLVQFGGTTTGLTLSGSMTGSNKFYILNFNGTGTYSFGSTPVETASNFSIFNGVVNAPSSTLTIGANFQNNPAGGFNNNGGTVIMSNTSGLVGLFNNMTGTFPTGSRFNNLTFNGVGGSWQFVNNADIAGNLTLTNGSLNAFTTLNVLGNVTIGTGTTMNSSAGITHNVGGNWTNNGSFNASTGTVNFNGAGSYSISGNLTGTNKFNTLTFNNSAGSWSFGGSNAEASSMAITAGSVTAPSGTLTLSGAVGTAYTNSGSFNHNNGTIIFTGSGAISGSNTGANKFNNLTFNAAGSSWSFSSTAQLAGNMTISNGTVTAFGGDMTVGGNWSNTSGNSPAFNHNNGTVNMNSATSAILSGNMTGSNKFNNLTFNGGGAFNMASNIDVNGAFNNAAGTVTLPSSLIITGNYTNSAIIVHNSGTVTMNGTGTMNGAMTGSNKFNNLAFSGTTYTFGANSADVNGNFNINSGTVTAPSTILQITGNYTNSATFTHNSGTVVLNGNTAGLTLNGNMTGGNAFNNLTINGTSGAWTATNGVTTANNFSILNGTFTAPAGGLIIGGSYTNNGVFNHNNSSVTFNGSATGLSLNGNMTSSTNGAFYNIFFNGTGTYTFNNNADAVFSFNQSNGTIVAPAGNLNVGQNAPSGFFVFNQSAGNFNPNNGTVTIVPTTVGATYGIQGASMTSTTGTLNCFNNLTFNAAAGTNILITPNSISLKGNFTNLGATSTVTTNGITLTVGGNWLNNGLHNAGSGTVVMNGTGSNTITGSGMTGTNRFNNLTFTNGGTWSFSSSNVEVGAAFNLNSGVVTAPSGTLTMSSTGGIGQFNNNGGSFVNNGGTVLCNGSNVSFNTSGAGTLTGSNKFNNMTFSGGATYTFNASAEMGGNFLNTSGTVVPGANTLTVGGNWTNNSAFQMGTSTVVMNGSATGLTLNGNLTVVNTGRFNNLTFNGTGSWSFSGSTEVGGNLNINSGTVTSPSSLTLFGNYTNNGSFIHNSGTVTLSGTGAQTLNGLMTTANQFNNMTFNAASGSYTFTSNADMAGSYLHSNTGTVVAPASGILQVAGSWSNNSGTFTHNNGTVVMNGTVGGLSLNGVMNGASLFNHLTFNGTGGAWTMTSNVTTNGNFSILNGTATAPAGLIIFGNYVNNGNFVHNNGTVQMNGNAGTYTLSGSMIGTNKFYQLFFNGTGTYNFGSTPAETANNFVIFSGVVTAPSSTLTVGTGFQNNPAGGFNNNGGTVIMSATSGTFGLFNSMTGVFPTGSRFNNLTFNGVGGSWQFVNPADIAGNLTLTNGSFVSGFTNLNVLGNVSIAAGNTLNSGAGIVYNVGGNWTNLGTFGASTGTVNMNGAGAYTISGNITGGSRFYNLTFNNAGGAWSFGSSNAEVANQFIITAGSVTAPSTTLTLSSISSTGQFNNNGGTFANNGGTLLCNGGNLSFNVSGSGTLTGSNKFNNMTFTGGNFYTFNASAEMGGNYLNSNGIVVPGANTLTVGGNWTNNSLFQMGTSTVVMNGSASGLLISGNLTTVNTGRFNNLTFNGTGSWSFSGATEVGGNLLINSGTVTSPSSLTLFGNYTNNGSFIHNSGTVTLSGTGAQTLNGLMTTANQFNNMTFNAASGSYTFTSNADMAGSYLHSNTGTVVAPASGILQVAGSWSNNSGTFTHNNGTVVMNGTVGGLSLNGVMNGGSPFNHLTFNGTGGAWTMTSNVTTNGNFSILNGTATAPAGLIVFGNYVNNGNFVHNNGTVQMNGNAGTFTLSGSMTGTNRFFQLFFNGTGTYNFGSTPAETASNFVIFSGVVVAPSSTLTVGTAFQNNPAGGFNNNGGTVIMSATTGTFGLFNSMTGVFPTGSRFNNLTFNGVGGSWQFVNAADVAGNLILTNGNVNASTMGTLNVLGNYSSAAGTTLTAPANFNAGGNWLNLGTFNNNSSLVTMNGTGSFSIGGNLTGGNRFYNLTFNNTGGSWSFGSTAAEVANNWLLTAGSVTAPSSNLTFSSISSTGSFVNNGGVFNHNGGTVIASGGAFTFGAGVAGGMTLANRFNNMTFSGGNTYSFTANADMAGNFLNNAGNVVFNSFNYNVGGNWTNNSTFSGGTSTVNMNSALSGLTLNGNMVSPSNFNNLNFTGGGAWQFNAAATANNNFSIQSGTVTAPSTTLTIGGTYTNNGTFTHNNGSVTMTGVVAGSMNGTMIGGSKFYNLNFTNTNSIGFGVFPCEVLGAFTQNGSGLVTAPGTTLTIGGINGTGFNHTSGTFNPSIGTVILNSATGLTITNNAAGMTTAGSNSFNHLTFTGTTGTSSYSWVANPFTVAGNWLISAGTVTAPNFQTVTVNGNWTNNGIFQHNSGTILMNGTLTTLQMSGNMTIPTNGSFYNLTFGNTGTFTCMNNMEVVNLLTQNANGTVYAPSILTIDNSPAFTSGFSKSTGTFVAPATTFFDGGAFTHTGGTFNPNGGTVVMNATSIPVTPYSMTTTNMVTSPTSCFNNLTFNGGAGVSWTMNTSATGLVNGNFVVQTGTVTPTTTTLTINGNFQNNAVFQPQATNTIVMGGTVGGLTMSGNMTNATFSPFNNLTFSGIGGAYTFGANPADVNGNFVITNSTVTAPSTTLQVARNWTNTGSFFNNSGTVNLNGTVANQVVSGATTFNNLTLNNSFGATLGNDETVNGALTLTSGIITLGGSNLILGPLSPFIGGAFSATTMINASGAGQIRKQMVTNGNYFFPMGDATNYTPFAINFTAAGYGAGAYFGINETAAKHPNNANVNNFLKRYWKVRTNAMISPSYTVTQATYVPGDITGTESLMSTGQYPLALPWLKYGTVDVVNHSLSTSSAVTTANGDFSGITTAPPTVSSSPNTAICFGQSTVINTISPTGDPTLSYAWSPANSLNASFGTSVVATPTVTTTYTVTITDGNGFTNTSTTNVIVNPLPTPIAGTTTICTGITSALTTSPSGGIWTSSNTFQATIGSTNGIALGVAAGTPTITYTLPTGCIATVGLTINTSPLAITGINNVCVGLTTNLFDGTPGGAWSSSNVAVGTVSTGGVVSGLIAGLTNISYTLPVTGCYATTPVTVNALPTIYNVTGGGSYCAGAAGVHVGLNGSQLGVNYQLNNGAVVVATMPGTGSALDFGFQTNPGTYTIGATNATTSCINAMNGSATVVINPLPLVYTISGGGSYCVGGTGLPVNMSGSQSGFRYQLMIGGVATGSPVTGTGFSLSFGNQTAPGVYTVLATNLVSGCTNMMTGSATIILNVLPTVYNVTGGGSYCVGGTGNRIGLSYSDVGVNYQLYNGATPVAFANLAGTGAPLDYGLRTATGTYTVRATNATTGCTSDMTGSAAISINFPPNAYSISASGTSYCAGGAGIDVRLSYSDAGVSYQLYNGSTAVGSPMMGVSNYLDFGLQTGAGNYTIVATTVSTGCTSNMIGSVSININPLPIAYNVGGTGSYCAGGTGVNVTLSNSENGITYKLMRGITLVSTITSTGGPLNFGPQTVVGDYTVVANNTVTGCSNNMTGVATVTSNPLPVVYRVTGGGAYCVGAPGVRVGLSYSDAGYSYQLYNGGGAVGTALPGANSALDFGYMTVAGSYSVVATNNVTGCVRNMTGNPTVVVNTNPAVFTVASGASSYCVGGHGVDFTLTGSETGVRYQLMNGSTTVGSTVSGTGAVIDFGYHTGAGAYTAMATNNTTGCTSAMLASPVIYVNSLPTAYSVTGGGAYCAGGAGVAVGMANSDTMVMYQLYLGSAPVGSAVAGNGGAITFGSVTAAGTYKVIGTNTATTCVGNMSDSANVRIISLPTVYTVTGGGAYCNGTGGSVVGLSGSQLGVNYQLYVGGVATGAMVAGTGRAVSFGLQAATGYYTVVANTAGAPCTMNMMDSVNVTINPLPTQFTTLGGGGYCVGGTGVRDSLSGSDRGVNYQLYNGTTPVGSAMPGTGDVLDFGLQTAVGTYHIVGTDATTHCSNTMIYTVDVHINPLPTVYAITGGGNYCEGTSGTHIGLSTGAIGVDYQLYRGLATVGSPVSGGGVTLDFGLQTVAGTYYAVAVNSATGCTNNMSGTATVGITSSVAPSVTINSNKGDTVCSGTTVLYTALAGNGGTSPLYSWTVNGAFVSAAPSFSYTPNNSDVIAVTLTSNAHCVMPATAYASLTMGVIHTVIPSVTVSSNPGDTVCRGTNVTYTAAPHFGGSHPGYNWYLNGAHVGSSLTYSTIPNNNDVVIFMLTSDMACRISDTVFSNDVIMHVENLLPTVSIISNPTIVGHRDTLTAVAHNAGVNPSYAWYVNGRLQVGHNANTLVSNQFVTGDSVSVVVTTGSGACAGVTASNGVIITVSSNVGVGAVSSNGSSINISPNPSNGVFTVRGTIASTIDETVAVELTDMIGQVVYKSNITAKKGVINSKITLDKSLANGMYILNLKSGNEHTVLHMVLEQ